MIQDAVQHHYILEQTDFTTNQNGTYTIAVPEIYTISFTRNQWLVVPKSIQYNGENALYTFDSMIDLILLVHPSIRGFDGKALPVQEATAAAIMTGFAGELYAVPSSPRQKRRQPEDQNNNLAVPNDNRHEKAYVGRNVAYTAPAPPVHTLKMAQNTRENHRLVMTYLSEERNPFDPMKIQPPLAVEMQVINGDQWFTANHHLIVVAAFGGDVEIDRWIDDDAERVMVEDGAGNFHVDYHTPLLGYPYGKAVGLSGAAGVIRVYKDISGDYITDESIVVSWSFSVDTWVLRETFNADSDELYAFRFRACWSRDSNQNMIWRQWGPVVGFTTNLAPLAPTELSMEL